MKKKDADFFPTFFIICTLDFITIVYQDAITDVLLRINFMKTLIICSQGEETVFTLNI